MKRIAAALVPLLIGSGGCSGGLLGADGDPPALYRLEAPAASAPVPARLPLALAVAVPRAAKSLDTDRVVVVQPGNRFDHYAEIRWAEPAPAMLQALLVRTLQAGGRFDTVVAAPSRVPTDLLLDVELRRFEASYPAPGAAPVVRVELQLTLVDNQRAQRRASLLATAEAAAAADRRAEVMEAFERATAQALDQAAAWLAAVEPAASGAAR